MPLHQTVPENYIDETAYVLAGPYNPYWLDETGYNTNRYIEAFKRADQRTKVEVMERFPQIAGLIQTNTIKKEEEDMLDYTQRMRMQVVTAMTKSGIPEDFEHVGALAGILKDIDKQEIDKKKLAEEAKKNANDADVKQVLKGIISMIGDTNIYETNQVITERDVRADEPIIAVELVE